MASKDITETVTEAAGETMSEVKSEPSLFPLCEDDEESKEPDEAVPTIIKEEPITFEPPVIKQEPMDSDVADEQVASPASLTEPRTPSLTTPTEHRTPSESEKTANTPRRSGITSPNRPGINWRKGEKLEAMDFMSKWYSAKIIEVDVDDDEVLIHFEGWNQRYDEWVDMRSDRLRPMTRHSVRKDKLKPIRADPVPGPQGSKLGDHVLAKWNDCKMYPAKITAIQGDSYEVIFYDGFSKTVQSINVKPLPDELKNKEFEIPSQSNAIQKEAGKQKTSPTLEGKRERHPSTPQAVKIKDRSTSSEKKVKDRSSSSEKKVKDRSSSSEKKVKERTPSSDKKVHSTPTKMKALRSERKTSSKGFNRSKSDHRRLFGNKQRLIVAGAFSANRKKISSDRHETLKNRQQKRNLEAKEETSIRKRRKLNVASLKISPEPVVPTAPVTADSVLLARSHVTHQDATIKKKKRSHSPSVSEASSESFNALDRSDHGSRKRTKSLEKVPIATGPPAKAFVVSSDHNTYKCMFDNCNKAFRKESLLDSHIKYYHTNAPPSAVPKKRKKLSSICSTDSEPSSASKAKGSQTPQISPVSKKKRTSTTQVDVISTDSGTITCPEELYLSSGEVTTAVGPEEKICISRTNRTHSQDQTDDAMETEDEESKEEVVHCLCGYPDENGLMIQCDTCFCWQHASCFGMTKDSLPQKYVCYVCENPPGQRESARFIHDQDWLRNGHLPEFDFIPAKTSESRAPLLQATNSLLADMYNVKEVVQALGQQLKAVNDPDDPEVRLWHKNWDASVETNNSSYEDHASAGDDSLDTKVNPEDSLDTKVNADNPLDTKVNSDPTYSTEMDGVENTRSGDLELDVENISRIVDDTKGDQLPSNVCDEKDNIDVTSRDENLSSSGHLQNECDMKQTLKQEANLEESAHNRGTDDVCENKQLEGGTDKLNNENSEMSKEFDVAGPGKGDGVDSVQLENDKNVSENSTKQLSKENESSDAGESKSNGDIPSTGGDENHHGDEGTKKCSTTREDEDGGIPRKAETGIAAPELEDDSSVELPDISVCDSLLDNIKLEETPSECRTSMSDYRDESFENCSQHLLEHIHRIQMEVNRRMDIIEQQVIVLEAADSRPGSNSDALSDLPQTKRSLRSTISDLNKVKKMAAFHS